MTRPVAVIIPFYQKNAGILPKAIESVLRQKNSHLLEALVVDDCSPVSAETELLPYLDRYREAIRIDPDWADAHNGLAVTFARQGRADLAVEQFREVTRIDPDSTIGYFNLATALADLDRDVEAAAALREVIRIYPDHYNAHYNLGEMFRLEGKFDESAKQFREYVRLAPNTPQTQRNLRRARQFIEQYSD